jgi:AcrR family transcriptional regulator
MSQSEEKRAEIVEAVARHLVLEGFRNSGLRALAASVGISDRMIMYYFPTKEDLVAEALMKVAGDMAQSLEQVLPARRASVSRIVESLVASGRRPEIQPTLRLWFEIVGLAMHDSGPYRETARRILSGWEDWIGMKLGPRRAHLAGEVLARIEGALMISLIRSEGGRIP